VFTKFNGARVQQLGVIVCDRRSGTQPPFILPRLAAADKESTANQLIHFPLSLGGRPFLSHGPLQRASDVNGSVKNQVPKDYSFADSKGEKGSFSRDFNNSNKHTTKLALLYLKLFDYFFLDHK
jgi:hypothetical protein